MNHNPADRRVQRTKQVLFNALMKLVSEKPYDKITVQEILEQANVGRTTFYTHFQSKEDLFLSSHEHIFQQLCSSFFLETGELRPEPSAALVAFLTINQQSRNTYFYLLGGGDRGEIARLLIDRIARYLGEHLHRYYQETQSRIPFSILSMQVASSLITLNQWWMEKRSPYGVREIAALIHEMNYVILRHALFR